MKIDLHVDDSRLIERIGVLKPQMRQSTALALKWTYFNMRDAIRNEMRSVFNQPTNWTLFQTQKIEHATVERLVAKTWLRDDASDGSAPVDVLKHHIFGGRRKLKGFELALQSHRLMPKGWIAIPGPGAKLNAAGNMNRGTINQIMSALRAAGGRDGFSANTTERSRARNKKLGDYFVSVPGNTSPRGLRGRLPYGVYERTSKGVIKTILRYRDAHSYKARFDYFGVYERTARADFPRLQRKAFKQVVTRALQ